MCSARRPKVGATPDSVFQIGSITKVWTTTLVMQLVDEECSISTARSAVPAGFRLADEASAAAQITTRQLLSHTGGFEGDVFTDTGRGDDAIEKYVGAIDRPSPAVRAGRAVLRNNNAGFSVLGRLVEVLREQDWEDARS